MLRRGFLKLALAALGVPAASRLSVPEAAAAVEPAINPAEPKLIECEVGRWEGLSIINTIRPTINDNPIQAWHRKEIERRLAEEIDRAVYKALIGG